MAELKEGMSAPEFALKTDNGGEVSLKSLKGKQVVLYFYPKDDTPGCTKEACSFRDSFSRLKAQGVEVIGVSKDNPEKHDKFKEKYSLPFMLASDIEGKVCEAYGVWVEKNMYGKKSMGIERSTFLIGENGVIKKIWRKVKVEGHVDEVLSAL